MINETINQLREQVAQLQREKAELVAQVENLKSKASHVLEYGVFYTYMQPLKDAIEATPTQCLNQIKAEAGRAGFIACVEHYEIDDAEVFIAEAAEKYAESIAKGE